MAGLSSVRLTGRIEVGSLTQQKLTPAQKGARNTLQRANDAAAEKADEGRKAKHPNRSNAAREHKAQRLAIRREQLANGGMSQEEIAIARYPVDMRVNDTVDE